MFGVIAAVFFCLLLAGFGLYRVCIRTMMNNEIRSIMAEYMPLHKNPNDATVMLLDDEAEGFVGGGGKAKNPAAGVAQRAAAMLAGARSAVAGAGDSAANLLAGAPEGSAAEDRGAYVQPTVVH